MVSDVKERALPICPELAALSSPALTPGGRGQLPKTSSRQ